MKIVFATPEIVPYSKTGGLADVSGALPVELAALGHEVLVVTPLYKSINRTQFAVEPTGKTALVPVAGRMEPAELYISSWSGLPAGMKVLLVNNTRYFDRKSLYGDGGVDYPDNGERFAFFSRAVLESIKIHGFHPEIIHGHDWQTGPIFPHLKRTYSIDPFFQSTKGIITIHNLGYQGLFNPTFMETLMLPADMLNLHELEFWGKVNYLKAGLVFSDAITTVSRRYAEEIRTELYGCGLEGLLEERKARLFGILNGVDYGIWSPETDPLIANRFDLEHLEGKAACKAAIQKEMGLNASDAPLIGLISRLADQKGFDLLAGVSEKVLDMGCQFAILGTGEKKYHEFFTDLKNRHPGNVGLLLGFDNALAHKIEAGSDMFLMPSRYEPCGLNQMYSLKYGTIPIVRAVGGLEDTIEDFGSNSPRENGFKFHEYKPEALFTAIQRAVSAFENKNTWTRLMKTAMSCDYSWKNSARNYSTLYERILRS